MAAIDRASPASSSRSLSPLPSVMGEEAIAEDTMFVAVAREFSHSQSLLLWALENRGASGISLLHVHIPDKLIPTAVGKLPVNVLNKPQIDAHRVNERERLSKKLDKHLQFCRRHRVRAGKIYIEMDSIQDGIVKLLTENNIKKLVMGAAADRRYTKNMIEILSEKAKYVKQHAPAYCHIWFVCKKSLIHTREATENPALLYPVICKVDERDERLRPTFSYEIGGVWDAQGSYVRDKMADEHQMPMLDWSFSPSTNRSSLSGPSAPDLTFTQLVPDGQKEIDEWLLTQQMQKPSDLSHMTLSPSSSTPREIEDSYLDEGENVNNQPFEILEVLEDTRSYISSLKSKIEEYSLMIKQLEGRLESATETVEKYKKERDEMKMERDNAMKQVDEITKQPVEESSSVNIPILRSKLNFKDIEKTTNKFDQSLKLGEDDYGITYKGFFNIQVVVKIAHPSSSSAPQEFQEEMELLNKLRHPNIVNLIGICSESHALIYEYCASGNLEDQISYKALLWRTRVKIATELCSVLMFLHSHKPHPIIHGDLRAENIHLDSDFTCKLNNFRASILVSKGTYSLENIATSTAVSYAYIDPEYFATGELTTRSDVYSFGIILLRLLTGKPAMRLIRQVQSAVDNTDELSALLDPSAEWPIQQAKLLADLALRCCEMTRDRRPDLDPYVWKALEPIKGLCD